MTEFYRVQPTTATEVWRVGPDGVPRKLTPEEVSEHNRQALVEEAERLATKGHDCWDHPVHSTFRSYRGGMQDAYHCALCGDLLQVG